MIGPATTWGLGELGTGGPSTRQLEPAIHRGTPLLRPLGRLPGEQRRQDEGKDRRQRVADRRKHRGEGLRTQDSGLAVTSPSPES